MAQSKRKAGYRMKTRKDQKKCPYCQGNEPLVNFDDTPIQIYIGFNEDSALSVDVDSAIYNLTFEIRAIYCPICGRRLRNDYD